ncbi:MAG: hypothetical protein J6A79_00725 [Clostridia bacterium]|nr:hypothetical protein [Clostridia bacterium]
MATSIIKRSNKVRHFTVPGNTTVTIPLIREKEVFYILSSNPSTSDSIFLAVGCGYGASSVRHKINILINANYFSVAPNGEQYGIDITNGNSGKWDFFLYIFQV